MRIDQAEDAQLGQLASGAGFDQQNTQLPQQSGGAAPSAPASANDPVQAAFDAVSKSAEDVYASSINSGVSQPAVGERITNDPTVQTAIAHLAQAHDPTAPFGGSDLVSALKSQSGDNFSPDDAAMFGQQVRSAALMEKVRPGTLEPLVKFREGLDPQDRVTFDEAHFGLFNDAISNAIASQQSGGGPVLSAPPVLSPRQIELENKWRKQNNMPSIDKGGVFHDQDTVDAFVKNSGHDLVDYLSEKAQMTGDPKDANTLATYKNITGISAREAWDAQRQTVIGPIAEAMGQAIAANPVALHIISPVSEAAGGPSAETINGAVEATTKAILTQVSSGDRSNVVALPLYTVMPFSKAATAVERIAFNGLTQGLASTLQGMGDEQRAGQQITFQQAAKDFSVGAFGGATLPELGHVLMALRGAPYSILTVRAALEDAGAKSQLLTRVTENNTLRLDAPPAVPTLADMAVPVAADPTERLVISADNLVGTRDPVSDMVAARLEAEKARSAAHQLETAQRAEQAVRDASAASPSGQFGGPGATQAERDLAVASQIASARTVSADANAQLTDAITHATEVATDAASKTAAENIDNTLAALPAIGGGADVEGVRKVVQQQYDDALELASRLGDPLSTQSGSIIARIHSTLTGVFPGAMGVFARAREDLGRALDVWTRGALDDLAKNANKTFKGELKGLEFIGPEEKRAFATKYPELAVESNPEWFKGSTLSGLHAQVQSIFDQKVKLLQDWGYDIKQLEGIFIPQMWEIDRKVTGAGIKGVVSTSKNRVFVNYEQGIAAGMTPKALTIGERWVLHDNALNQALSDAIFKKMLIQKGMLTKGSANALTRSFETNSGLFKGYVGDKGTVEAIDTLFRPAGAVERNVRGTSARIKTTLLGLGGPVAVGTHFVTALIHGNVPLALSQVEKVVDMLHLPGAINYDELSGGLGDRVFAARAGVQLGQRSVDLAPRGGTVLGMLPFMKKPDQLATKLADTMGHAVFGTLSDPFRIEMFKGMLFLQKLTGHDVADPAVLKAAADFVNRSFLSSAGAQSPLRSALENTAFLSARTTRGEAANLLSIGDLPKLIKGDPRAITAAVSLASLASSVYAIQYAAHQAFGGQKPEWNPLDTSTWKNFGVLNVNGRTIRFVKEKGLIDAMQKSFVALKNEDPQAVSDVWSRFYVGKSGPLPQDALSLLGYGYDKDGFYQNGGLASRDRLLNLIPFPIVSQSVARGGASKFDAEGMALEAFGMANYLDSTAKQRDDFLRDPANNPYKPDDPRYQMVVQNGYKGMERAEQMEFKQNHPEFFNGQVNYPSAEAKAAADKIAVLQNQLWNLNNEVVADPTKRRDYKDARKDIETQLSALYGLTGAKASQPVTPQAKAVDAYYKVIDGATKLNGGTLDTEQFGRAVDAARAEVLKTLGQDGVDALDRYQSTGQTPLDSEYRVARQKIADSGYYQIADAAAKRAGPFTDYNDFVKEVGADAKARGVDVAQHPALAKINAEVTKAKQAFRAAHPDIDALISIWDGGTPRTQAAASIVSGVLGVKENPVKNAPKAKASDILSALR